MSNRLYRSERHASLSLEADTRPGYRISHELHDEDFGVLPGARSESVGAEHEPVQPVSRLELCVAGFIRRAQKCAGWLIFIGIVGAFAVAIFPKVTT